MAKGLVSDTNLTAIANSIREKNGSSDTYTPAEMAQAISDIPTSQVDQESALQWMLNNKTDYTGIAAGLTNLTELPEFTQPSGVKGFMAAFKNDSSLISASSLSLSSSYLIVAEMFSGCTSLTLPPTFATTARATSGSSSYRMFYNCTNLQSVSLHGQFFTASVNTAEVFYGCTALTNFNSTNELRGLNNTTDAANMFANCSSLRAITLQGRIGPSSSTARVNCNNMFGGCTSLETFSTTSFDMSSHIQNSVGMFFRCNNLKDFPAMNLENIVSMQSMFTACWSLTNDSLDNILASLATASSYTGTKTLKYIGLSSAQATTCTTLSNWAALSAAGWTTGY